MVHCGQGPVPCLAPSCFLTNPHPKKVEKSCRLLLGISQGPHSPKDMGSFSSSLSENVTKGTGEVCVHEVLVCVCGGGGMCGVSQCEYKSDRVGQVSSLRPLSYPEATPCPSEGLQNINNSQLHTFPRSQHLQGKTVVFLAIPCGSWAGCQALPSDCKRGNPGSERPASWKAGEAWWAGPSALPSLPLCAPAHLHLCLNGSHRKDTRLCLALQPKHLPTLSPAPAQFSWIPARGPW